MIDYIDVVRVVILLATLTYASKLDIESRRVPHKVWVLPVILGCLLINTQLVTTRFSLPTPIYLVHLLLILICLIAATVSCYLLAYNKTLPSKNIWLIPLTVTITALGTELVLPQLTTVQLPISYLEVVTKTFSNILLAIIIGLFLHKFPRIGMGGADFIALSTVGILLPTTPHLGPFPYMTAPVLPFPQYLLTLPFITIITNIGFAVLLYLPTITVKNIIRKETKKSLFLTAFTKEVPVEEVHETHGRLIQNWNLQTKSLRERVAIYFSGIDTEFFRDYLEWREDVTSEGITSVRQLEEVHLEHFLQAFPNKWGTNNFEEDKKLLDTLFQQESVRVMPGLPFVVPILLGVLATVTVGDIMLLLLLLVN